MAHNGERFSASVAGDRTATSQHFSSLTGLFMVSSLLAVLLLPAVFGRSRDPLRQSAPETTKRLKGSGNAQDVYELELGKSIKRELAGGQQHTYELKLGADQFAQAIVEQEGIDVTVQVLGPDGKQMLEFDSEARLQGVEEVPLVAEAAGDYQLIVQSKSKGAPPGGYEIRIEELRAATERDRTLQEARRLYEEAVKERGEGKLDEALTLTEHALGIRKKLLGPDHRDVAATITYLGLLYSDEGEYAKAEPLYQQALNIFERELGPEHPNVAMVLNNLAILYRSRGEYTKAEPAIQRALAIREKALGPEHILVAQSLNSLAILYFSNSEYVKAEPLYQRALAIWEKALGPEHPDVAKPLSNLAVLYGERGEYAKAEPFYRRALAIREKAL
ncbi:MAG: tetratricopeptide repeat-containing protein, partial [Ktedonobacteraceae bacterium]|nr:tetratricopeptide repeat-containing protein [Ktedonobacteraceae bacterium]